MNKSPILVCAIRRNLLTRNTRFSYNFNSTSRFRGIMSSTNIPPVMRGIQFAKIGSPEVLEYKEDLPTPSPSEGQVLVKNEAAGVNYIDTYFRTGVYNYPLPGIVGNEGAGTIVSLGPGETYGLKVGDRVAFMGKSTYASYCIATALHTHKLPDDISFDTGAAAILQGLTAITMIRESYHVQKGDWVLVQAGAGGTGSWLCQLLRAVGARVIGSASTEEKRALAKKNGAEFVFGYDDLPAKVKELTGGKGVHAIFDGIGKDTFEQDFELLARKGTLVCFGNASGVVPPFSILKLGQKNIKLARPSLYQFIVEREEFEEFSADLFSLMEKHNMHPAVTKYPLKEARKAHEDLEGRKTTGKLLIEI